MDGRGADGIFPVLSLQYDAMMVHYGKVKVKRNILRDTALRVPDDHITLCAIGP